MQLSEPKEFIKIKDRYANILLATILAVGFAAISISLLSVPIIGWRVDNTIDSIGYLTILTIYLFRKKISTSVKIGIVIIFSYFIGTTGLIVNSVTSMFMPYYITGALFTMLFFDYKKTIVLVSVQVITVVIMFSLKVLGILTFKNLDANFRAFSDQNWLNFIFTFLLFVVIIIIFSRRFYDTLKQAVENLNSLNTRLSFEIESKENAYEEVAAAEEELKTTNDELMDVNKELSIRNKELISTLWKLQESETRFKTLFNIASDTFLILKDDVLIECNKAAETIFKMPKEALIGKKIYDLSPKIQADGSPSDQRIHEILNKVLTTETSMYFEWQHKKGNQEIFTAHVSLNHFYFNKEDHYHAIVRDITDQKKFEHNLTESEDKFKKLFEFNPAAIALSTFNEHFKCLDVNQGFEKLLKLSKDQIIGKSISGLGYSIPPELYAELRSKLKKDGYFRNIEIPVKLSDNTTIHCNISGIMVTILNEPMVMSITSDITEQKQNEAKLLQYKNYLEELVNERTEKIRQLNDELSHTNENLIQSNEKLHEQKEELTLTLEELKNTQSQLFQSEKMASLGVLTAGIAHEINNPINFISSGIYGLQIIIQSLTDHIHTNDPYKKNLQKNIKNKNDDDAESIDHIIEGADKLFANIQLGVDRAISIIQNLKTFTFKGSGAKDLMDIHVGLEATLVIVNHLVKGRIEIIKNYGEIPMVYCQSSQINQVFMNVICNAIDSIKEKGTITISTSADVHKNKIIISITDTGLGIPEEIKKRIFEPFYTTKDVGKGTGLGLAISYNIMKEHCGKLYFKSLDGKGTIFYIELPIQKEK